MLLATWERERRGRITLSELRQTVGSTAYNVARRLTGKGALQRIGRGIYSVRPFRTLTRPSSPSTPVLVAYLLTGEPYYLGGLWALTLHRLTSQQYNSRLDVFVTRKRRRRTLGHAAVDFHVLKPAAFRHGVQVSRIEDVDVQTSGPERTLLDLLDHPDVAGGMLPTLELVKGALKHVDMQNLVDQAVQGSRDSTCQRLGVLLERSGASQRSLGKLKRHLRNNASRLSMVPQLPRRGRLHPDWDVVENDIARAK
jgi:predicted transcriptional regulator of viral defense system